MSESLQSNVTLSVPITARSATLLSGGAVSRQHRSLELPGEYKPGNTIYIKIPSEGWLDFSASKLCGTLIHPNDCYVTQSIHSVFKHILIRSASGVIIDQLRDMDVLANVLPDYTMNNSEREFAFGVQALYGGDDVYRKALGSGEGSTFCISPMHSLLRTSSLIPTHLTGALNIEIVLNDAVTCMQGAGTATYTLKDMAYKTQWVSFTEAVESSFLNAWRSQKGLTYRFDSWTSQPSNDNSPIATIKQPILGQSSVDGFLVVPRLESTITSQAKNSYQTYFGSLDTIDFTFGQHQVNRVNAKGGAAEVFGLIQDLLQQTNHSNVNRFVFTGKVHPTLNPDGGTAGNQDCKFVFGLSTELARDSSHISGNHSKSDMTVRFNRTAQPPGTVQYLTYTLADRVITISAERGLEVRQ